MRINEVLLIGCGGFVGAICRYMITMGSRALWPATAFPAGTFIANMIGCLLIGVAMGLIDAKVAWPEPIRLMIIVGFLGGFTTFSSFAYETWHLFRSFQFLMGFLNIGLQMMLGLFLVGLGFSLSKLI